MANFSFTIANRNRIFRSLNVYVTNTGNDAANVQINAYFPAQPGQFRSSSSKR